MSNLEKTYVTYEEFGAKGDSITDDFCAIYDTHVYANEHGLSVLGNAGKVYYLGEDSFGKTIPVMTDVDFGGATFIIDDSKLPPHTGKRGANIFAARPSPECDVKKITGEALAGKSIKCGDKNIGMTFDSDSLVTVINGDESIFIRYGWNSGTSKKSEMLIVDKDGNVDESTPVMWDYDHLTEVNVRPLTENPITIKNGTFITIANQLWPFTEDELKSKEEGGGGWLPGPQYYYYSRGIAVNRNNTTLSGITHIIKGEKEEGGYPYGAFYGVGGCCNVLIENCKMTGHRRYHENRPDGHGTDMGSYDINAGYAVGITWRNCTQLNDITDTNYWGVMCSNFSRNLTYDGCVLSRFDAHQGAWNVTVKNTTLGHSFSVVGGGELYVENVKKVGGYCYYFLALRGDYGSTWHGNVTFKDCEIYGAAGNGEVNILHGSWVNWNFGYTCYMPENIVIDNFKSDASRLNLLVYEGATAESFAAGEGNSNPLTVAKTITVKNMSEPICLSKENNAIYGVYDKIDIKGELN